MNNIKLSFICFSDANKKPNTASQLQPQNTIKTQKLEVRDNSEGRENYQNFFKVFKKSLDPLHIQATTLPNPKGFLSGEAVTQTQAQLRVGVTRHTQSSDRMNESLKLPSSSFAYLLG